MRWGSDVKAILLMVTGLSLVACATPEQTGAGAVLARYRGGEVTRAEFNAHVERQARAGRSLIEGEGDWRLTILEKLAVTEIVAQAAPESPVLARLIAEATDSTLETAMVERLGWNHISVSAEEVRRYYDDHPEIFVEPAKLRLQHIFLRAAEGTLPAEERAAVRRRLVAIRRQILDGADFAALAKEHSDSADGAIGGWMVLRRGARVVRSFTEAAWSLEEGEVSEPIDTPTGFQIARLAARIAPVERPFEEARQLAGEEALKVMRRRLEESYLAEQATRYGFERGYEALSDRDATDDTVLFSLDGTKFTVRDMLATVGGTLLPHYYAGYLEHLPRALDQRALGQVLILEARAEGLESDDMVERAVAQTTRDVRAAFEIERLLTERNQATPDEDFVEFYERNKDHYETPRRRSLSVVRLPPEKGRSLGAVLEDGGRLVEELRAGADFAEIARQRSHHPSAAAGGRLLELTDEEIRTQVQSGARGRQAIDALHVGEVSSSFVGEVYDRQKHRFEPAGVYVVRLDKEVPPRPVAFDEVKDMVRADYLGEYRTRLLAELKDSLLAEAEFEIVEAGLSELGG